MTHPKHWLDWKEMWKPYLVQNHDAQAVLGGHQPGLGSTNHAEGTVTLVLLYICSFHFNTDTSSFLYLWLLFIGTSIVHLLPVLVILLWHMNSYYSSVRYRGVNLNVSIGFLFLFVLLCLQEKERQHDIQNTWQFSHQISGIDMHLMNDLMVAEAAAVTKHVLLLVELYLLMKCDTFLKQYWKHIAGDSGQQTAHSSDRTLSNAANLQLFVLTLAQKYITTIKILTGKIRVLAAWNNHGG